MYLPTHFSAPDAAAVDELVRTYPLASLVVRADPAQTPTVDPVVLACAGPVIPGALLTGHVARANPICAISDPSCEVTAIFTGPRAYISPNWYPSKQVHHRVVPTFNYCTVVVHGRMRLIDGADEKLEIVRSLTDQMEAGQPGAWSVDDAPPAYIEQMLKAIVGLSIEIVEVQTKFKISQNRDPLDRGAVQMELEAAASVSDAQVMAELMQRFKPE